MKTSQDLVSIIVPVYNVSAYLQKSVGSVVGQTCQNWELILVDDASTDGSGALCDRLAAADSRIRVLHVAHGGPALARNAALAVAEGDIVYFMDSDDWIEPDLLEVMLRAMHEQDADIVVFGVFFDYPGRTKTVAYTRSDCILSRNEALRMIITGRLPSYLPLMLWRRSVVQEPYVDVPCYEDYATGYKWFAHARRVLMLTAAKYHYVQREGSILHTARRDKFLLDIYRNRHQYIAEHQLMNERDNRANTVRNYLKLAKDFARKPIAYDERIAFVGQLRDELGRYLPVSFGQLGLKRWLRLKLLFFSVSGFVRLV